MSCIHLYYDKKLINDFKRKAQDSHKEVLAYMCGTVDKFKKGKKVRITIEELTYPKVTSSDSHVQDVGGVSYPKRFIGSLHSHPYDTHQYVSKADIESAQYDGGLIFGIYTCGEKNLSRLDFYVTPQYTILTHAL